MSVANGTLLAGQIVVDATAGSAGYTQLYDAAGHRVAQQRYGADMQLHQAGLVLEQSVVDLRGEITTTYAPHLLSSTTVQVASSQTFDADGRLLETRH